MRRSIRQKALQAARPLHISPHHRLAHPICTSNHNALPTQRSISRTFQPLHVRPASTSATSDPEPKNPNHTETIRTTPQTHYDLFPTAVPHGPPPNGPFALDLRALRREFLQLQAAAHPDRHPGSEAKARAEAASAHINQAYKTLQDPLARAVYVLGLNGVDVEDEAAKLDDEALLMRVMEAREEIEEAGSRDDLAPVKTRNDEAVEESVRVLEALFAKGDWEAARGEAVKLRYWMNIRQSVQEWEPGKPVVLVH